MLVNVERVRSLRLIGVRASGYPHTSIIQRVFEQFEMIQNLETVRVVLFVDRSSKPQVWICSSQPTVPMHNSVRSDKLSFERCV